MTKKYIVIALFFLSYASVFSQKKSASELYGNVINLGVGVGYYNYLGQSLPVLHVNYEFDVAKNFTLAPFATFYSYRSKVYWGSSNHSYKDYTYHQTVVPIGLKGTYYFDQLLNASSKWDFYLGLSLGVVIRKTVWDDEYYGDKNIEHSRSATYLDGHIGAEYHINSKIGLQLDLSTGQSTVCLAIHL